MLGANVSAKNGVMNDPVVAYFENLPQIHKCQVDESAIGEYAYIHNLGRVTIGARATISHRAHLCAGIHDHTKSDFPLLRPPIFIGDQSWIRADAFVGPGVTIGEGAIVDAGAVVTKDIAPWMIAVGNPARAIKRRAVTE